MECHLIIRLTENNIEYFEDFLFSRAEILRELKTNPFAMVLGYIKKNRIVGYLYYSEIYERIEINQLEVQRDNRNCGIANSLMEYLIKTVDKDITLEVRKDNFEALNLYEKFGFQKKAVRKRYYQGIDGILMERKVTNCLLHT